ncbi:MAG: hypothetical protein ACC608_00635 [Anaerofustis sp.]
MKGEEETGRIKTTDAAEMTSNNGNFYDRLNEIGRDSSLTDQQKVESIIKEYNELSDKKDIIVPADIKFLKEIAFDKEGRPQYDWPEYLGFVKKSIKPIKRNSFFPDLLSRMGSRRGNNLTVRNKNGEMPTLNKMSLPYLENPSAIHDCTVNDSYFDVIDAIREGSLEKLNNIVGRNGKDNIPKNEFDIIKSKYRYCIDQLSINGINNNAIYGLQGIVAPWIDKKTNLELLSGGAKQFTIPLNIETLLQLGVISKY